MPRTPDVAILCGGMGTRLRSVLGERPKVLAEVDGRPFLDFLIETIVAQGFQRIVLCTGQGRDQIRRHVSGQTYGAEVLFSEETSPLGTGGALRLCRPHIQTDRLLLLNGDSYTDLPLDAFCRMGDGSHRIQLAVVPAHGRDDAGNVNVNEQGLVTGFHEKSPGTAPGYISAGIYLISRAQLEAIPGMEPCSIEYDLMPEWVRSPGVTAVIAATEVVDIGTPERLMAAGQKLWVHDRGAGGDSAAG